MKIFNLIALLLILFSLSSCTLFIMIPLEISAYTPTGDVIENPSDISVSITFSTEVDMTKGELAFSLSEGGSVMDGAYIWSGKQLRFTPYKPFSIGRTYTIIVSPDVEDRYGNSMDRGFSHVFKTGSDDTRPVITASSPADNAVITDLFTKVAVTFSEAVDVSSFYEAFALSPPVKGTYTWSADYATCTFTPLAAYTWQTEYLVTLSPTVTDPENNTLAEELRIKFHTGSDTVPPAVVSIENTARTVVLAEDLPGDVDYTVTAGWESSYGIRLEFSEPVDTRNFTGLIQFEPVWSFDITWNDSVNPTVATLQGNVPFLHGTTYTLRLTEGLKDQYGNETITPEVYRWEVDGPLTTPPVITRVTYRTGPSDPVIATLTPYGNITFTGFNLGQEGFFDIYIDLAQAAEIDLFSFMDAFLVSSTNSCVSFIVTRLETGVYTGLQPVPLPDAGINETVVRVYLKITNTAAAGLINLRITTGLADKQGVHLVEEWKMILIETL